MRMLHSEPVFAQVVDAVSLNVIEPMLNQLPRAPFFVKDAALRYVCVNQAMLDLCGAATKSDMLGKTAREFFPENAWRRYEALDRQVMRTGRPVTDQLDLTVRMRGYPIWILFGRFPVTGDSGEVCGVAAIARNLGSSDRGHPDAARLAPVIEHMKTNLAAPLDVADLARRAAISVSQLERDFINLFGVSPRGFLTKVRFEAAFALLQNGDAIADIAHACGYTDQSAFTRRFRATVGMSPTQYRRSIATKI